MIDLILSYALIIVLIWLLNRRLKKMGAKQQPAGSRGCAALALTLKAPRKNASEKLHLLMPSAANNCLTLLTILSIEANRVDPEQTAPIGAV